MREIGKGFRPELPVYDAASGAVREVAASAPPLNREAMADFLGLPKRGDERERILDALTPAQWAEHEEFAQTIERIKRWDRGEGPLPPGVIACGRRKRR